MVAVGRLASLLSHLTNKVEKQILIFLCIHFITQDPKKIINTIVQNTHYCTIIKHHSIIITHTLINNIKYINTSNPPFSLNILFNMVQNKYLLFFMGFQMIFLHILIPFHFLDWSNIQQEENKIKSFQVQVTIFREKKPSIRFRLAI